MKDWYNQWDDFLNEQEEPKLKSSGNVDAHLDQTVAKITPAQKQDIKSELENLFQDKEFAGMFAKYQSDPDKVELQDKDYLSGAAEEFIRGQGLSSEVDLPGADAAIAFLKKLKEKFGSSAMEERYTLDGPGPNPANSPSKIGFDMDDAVASSVLDGSDMEIKP